MRSLIFCVFLITTFSLVGQHNLNPCGTPPGKSQWLVDYQKNPSIHQRSATTLYLPLTLHIVGNNSGEGIIMGENLLGSLCTLNEDFKDADIQFYIDGDINFIYKNAYFSHSTVLDGAEMMFANNRDSTINNYIVNNPAGNCGYNLPYAGVALSINCTEPVDHTWAHELGHNFSLPHPFLGWEGGVSHDGSVSHNYSEAAPETVLFDYTYFKDTLILDTMIIDTAFVEKVDGSNCSFAADGFCDTKPDYLAIRWNCSTDGFSTTRQHDPNGEQFRSEGSLIMSYANDECSNRFTEEQISAMRANVTDERTDLLKDQSEPELIPDPTVTLISPKDGAVEDYRYINLEWEPVESATYYVVKISASETMSSNLYSGIVSDNKVQATVNMAFQNRDLYWSIIPFNKYDFCGEFTTPSVFRVSEISNVDEAVAQSITFYPTVNQKGGQIQTDFKSTIQRVDLYTMDGQKVMSQKNVNQSIELPTDIEAGVYLIKLNYKGVSAVQKIIII